ncbi:MAG: MATE family efflux transporter [Succinivibrio sp.]|nr:MATE family efflux transporter [Succinivibrio sp.]
MSDSNSIQVTQEITTRGLFRLSWPIFVDIGLHFATLMINMAMVGMISVEAVAELTVGNQVFDLGLILFNFINVGLCVVTAQCLGNGNKRKIRRVVHMGLGLNILWGSIVSLSTFFGSGLIVEIMQVPPEIKESSQAYLMILALGFLPEAVCLCCAQLLRAFECTRDSMYVAVLINLITIVGNSIFLFGLLGCPVMGVEGVAISTVLGRTVAIFVFIYLVRKRTRVRLVPRFFFVFKLKILKQILSIGLPGAGENLSWHSQYMVMTAVIASLGAIPLATHGIYFQMCMILMIFSIAIGMATEILIAHFAGAMKLKLAYRQLMKSVKIGMIFTICVAITIPLGLGRLIFLIFTDSEEVLSMAAPIFWLTLFMEPGRILNIIIINSLRAVGDTKFPVVMAILSMWGVSVTIGTFLSVFMGMGLLGVWIGFCLDEWTRGISMLIRWRSKAWVGACQRNYRMNFKGQH